MTNLITWIALSTNIVISHFQWNKVHPELPIAQNIAIVYANRYTGNVITNFVWQHQSTTTNWINVKD